MMGDDKTCPRCAETIKAEARVCRFCGYEYRTASDIFWRGTAPRDRQPNSFQSCMSCLGVGAVLVLFLFAGLCSDRSTGGENVQPQENATASPASPRFDPVAIEAMEKQLRAEPKILDVLFDDRRSSVTWQVGVRDDGTSRRGYAKYVCFGLSEKSLVDEDTSVRIVDLKKLESTKGNFRAASLAHIRCQDDVDMGV